MKKVLRFRVVASAVFQLCLATAIVAPAQTFTSLVSFDEADGKFPYNLSLVQGFDGNFYGTASEGGALPYVCGALVVARSSKSPHKAP